MATRPGVLPLLVIALAFGGAGLISQRSAAPEPLIAPPPEIRQAEFWGSKLPDLANRPQPMKQWLGQVVVVNFWAAWCPPCRREIPGFIALQRQYGARGVQFVGIALDEADKAGVYAKQVGINYPVLLGGDDAMRLSLVAGNGMGGLPYTLIFDRQGRAITAITGAVAQTRLEALVTPLL